MISNLDTPRHLQDIVDCELESGESIVWSEMPIPQYFTAVSTGAFLFGIPWTAFAIFWMYGASGFNIPDFKEGFTFFPLFGLPFVLIGFAMLSSPLWAYKKALNTFYVITNRRAITFDWGWSMTIRSYPPEKLQDLYRKERRNGTGDVIISHRAWCDLEGDRHTVEQGFIRIRNPKDVEQMLKKLAKQDVR